MDRVREAIEYDTWKLGGLDGSGVGIAVLDSGLYLHEDLSGRVACFRDFLHGRPMPYDDNGHGTHIAGSIAGNGHCSGGKYMGIAPGSHIIGCKVLDEKGNGNTREVLEALRFCVQKREQYAIRLVNISIGTIPRKEGEEKTSLIEGVEEAWDAGLVVVVAAGNNGPRPMTVTTPGISRKVITVGSSDDASRKSLAVGYSGRGPTRFCIVKPEIVAPGLHVTSCENRPRGYCEKSGSSMATAVVTGALALLLQKYPHMSNRDVKLRLYERCVDIGKPKNQQGWGMLNLHTLL